MRALVFLGPHRLRLDDLPPPEPGPGQVRIRVARVGICGSDLHGYTGGSGRRVAGSVMGHEASGWIEALGPGVEGPEVGTPVTFNPMVPCNGACGHDTTNRCLELRLIGVSPDLPGALAEALLVPADRVVPIDTLSLDQGATIEPMAVAVHAVRRVGARAGETVAVIGGGMIGLCLAFALRNIGARPVVSEPVEDRRELARRCGFEAVHPEALPGLAPFDRSLDAVGVSATASSAVRVVVRGGSVGFVGLESPEIRLPLFDLVTDERTVVGSFGYTDEVFRETAARMANGSLATDPLIGTPVGLEEAPRAFQDLATGRRTDVKVLVETGTEPPGDGPGR